ncbi:MAG: TrkA family potassium uptake protein [Clostridiales bacterium]|nr:TrkA family potassium uptake protein [Clostridiales bacterium]
MKSVLLIGMGKFGCTLGEKLLDMGDEVMIVDKNEDVINELAGKYENALIANCMNADNLQSLDIPSFDVCIVTIGDDFQSSLEITSNLKDLGAKWVISKATTEIQRKFLMRVGADEIIYPDRDIAEKLAIKLNATNVINYVDLGAEFSIFEIELPDIWKDKTVMEINPRVKHGMNILTVHRGTETIATLGGDFVFCEGDRLVVFGKTDDILSFTKKSVKEKGKKKKEKKIL